MEDEKDKIEITMSDLRRIKYLLRGDPTDKAELPRVFNYTPVWQREGYSERAECAYLARLIDALYGALWKMGDDKEPLWGEVDSFEPHMEISPQSPYIRIEWHFQGDGFDQKHFYERVAASCGKAEKEAAEKKINEIKVVKYE